MCLREKVLRKHIEGLYQKLSEITCQTPESFHFYDFELRDGELYYKGKAMPVMIRGGGKLRLVGVIAELLGKKGLLKLSFNISKSSKLMA